MLLLDNASIHANAEFVSLLRLHGILVMPIPAAAYSPDLDPVELVFNMLKSFLRTHSNTLRAAHCTLAETVNQAFFTMTEKHCESFIRHVKFVP
jgi:transposase